jgi:hypothetical protein
MKKLIAYAGCILLGALLAGSSYAAPHPFVGPTEYATAAPPWGVWTADLNGDGNRDVVTVDDSDTVSVLLGNGDGSFERKRSYKTGSVDIADLGDLNGDGRADLAVGNSDEATVAVMLNAGNGSFRAGHEYATGGPVQDIEIADLNAAGRPDLLTLNSPSDDENANDENDDEGPAGTVSVLVNRGDGRFGARRDFELKHDWNTYALGDVNRDGAVDLVTANADEDTVSVLLNGGAGGFGSSKDYEAGHEPYDIVIRDLNGDGKPDLAVENYEGSDDDSETGSVSVLLNRGDGTFRPRHDYNTGAEPNSLQVGDLNGDGKADLLTHDWDDRTFSVLANKGDGSFATRRAYPVGDDLGPVAMTDLNGDGDMDLVGVAGDDSDENKAYVFLNDGHGGFPARRDIETGLSPVDLALGDLNGDGRRDLVVADSGQPAVSVFLNTIGKGKPFVAPAAVFPHAQAYDADAVIESVAVGDVNGDGRQDIVTTNRREGTASVLLSRQNGFAEPKKYGVGRAPHWAAIGDLNGDRAADLAVVDTRDDAVSILLNAGNGTFTSKRDYPTGHRPYTVAIGDLDGDGTQDLAVGDAGPINGLTVSVLMNAGDGSFPTRRAYRMPRAPISVALGDVNGDGRMDIVTANHQRLSVSVLLNLGGGTFGSRRDYHVGRVPRSVALGDLNGDGAPDLAVANMRDDRISVLLNAGDGTFADKRDYSTGSASSSVAIADFDGDGAADLATADADGWTVCVFPGKGDGTFGDRLEYPVPDSPGFLATGDVDGDGAPDVVATLRSSVAVHINGTTQSERG